MKKTPRERKEKYSMEQTNYTVSKLKVQRAIYQSHCFELAGRHHALN
jgi:hypothetical protein